MATFMDALRDIASGVRAAIVVFQAVMSTYVASVVGVAFILGPYALTSTGLFLALFGLRYTFLPGVAGLIAAYFWMRRMRSPNWAKAAICVLWGALVGFLWFAFQLTTAREPHYLTFGTLAGVSYFFKMYGTVLLAHVVPGAVGALVFWLLTWPLTRRRVEGYT
jgi:hypothetical protein